MIVCRELWIAQATPDQPAGGWIIGGIFSSRSKAEAYATDAWPDGGWQVSRWWLNNTQAPFSPPYVDRTAVKASRKEEA